MLEAWAAARDAFDPGLVIEIESLGSSTGPPALIAGRAAMASMSRRMRPAELAAFQARFGYAPTPIRVSVDAVLVFVSVENPVDALALPELDAIYSSTLSCGVADPVERWGDVGARGDWARRSVRVCGRGESSGTHAFFRERALCGGHFRDDLLLQPGAASVERFVAEGLCGIGYGGLGARRAPVKVLPVSTAAGTEPVAPTDAEIFAGGYPLARHLLLYINLPPDGAPPEPLARFLRYVLSSQGQEILARMGFLPLGRADREAELAKLGR
jgi:phosphate transport system substrate-binding protein